MHTKSRCKDTKFCSNWHKQHCVRRILSMDARLVGVDGTQAGPFTDDELIKLIKADYITSSTLVWQAGMTSWTQALALLIGFVCEVIASEEGGRNWIALCVASASIASGLVPAFGLTFENARRGVSIKITAWLLSIALCRTLCRFQLYQFSP